MSTKRTPLTTRPGQYELELRPDLSHATGLRTPVRVHVDFGRLLAGAERTRISVVGLVAVRAPVAFQLAAVGVQYRDTFVAITVCDVCLVRIGIERDFRNAREAIGGVAVWFLNRTSILGDEFAVARELQNLRVLTTVTADPYIVLVIDGDAVIRRWPVEARATRRR